MDPRRKIYLRGSTPLFPPFRYVCVPNMAGPRFPDSIKLLNHFAVECQFYSLQTLKDANFGMNYTYSISEEQNLVSTPKEFSSISSQIGARQHLALHHVLAYISPL